MRVAGAVVHGHMLRAGGNCGGVKSCVHICAGGGGIWVVVGSSLAAVHVLVHV